MICKAISRWRVSQGPPGKICMSAVSRSRSEEISVAGVFLLGGEVATKRVRSVMWACLSVQVAVGLAGARNNRSGLIRVPIPKRANPLATRIEYRSPDPACNPYLAFSVILAAGLRGIEQKYELPAEADANLFEMGDDALTKLGIDQLPQSLSDALKVMENSSLVHEALGEHIFEWFVRNKRSEWRGYKTQVTPFELNRYLRSL